MATSSAKVSTFELLVKPIAPGTVTFARKVISGYFLTLSNLCEDSFFRFLVVIPKFDPATGNPADTYADRELTVSGAVPGPPPPVDPSGITNHNAIYDVTGGPAGPPTFGQTAFGEFQYLGDTDCVRIYLSPEYELCSGGTALFTLLPNLQPGPDLLPRERFEVRGYISIGLYRLSGLQADVSSSIDYLLTPEQRGSFLPLDVDSGTDPVDLGALDQLDTSVAPVEGPIVSLTIPHGSTPANVQNWAAANGLSLNLIRPFNNILAQIV